MGTAVPPPLLMLDLTDANPFSVDIPPGECPPGGYVYCATVNDATRKDLHELASTGGAFCDYDGDCVGDTWCPSEEVRNANACVKPAWHSHTRPSAAWTKPKG